MGDDWANYVSEYGLPTLSTNQMTQLGFTMDDVAQITIGTNDITWEENQFRDTEETATEVRVEYFRIVEPGDDEYWSPWYEYLGSVETRGGFIEVRNSDWETVARIADASALLDAQQVDAMINGFEAAEFGSKPICHLR